MINQNVAKIEKFGDPADIPTQIEGKGGEGTFYRGVEAHVKWDVVRKKYVCSTGLFQTMRVSKQELFAFVEI